VGIAFQKGIDSIELRVEGKIDFAEYRSMQESMLEQLEGMSQVRVLVFADGFEGWEGEGEWGDLSIQARFDPLIARMAVICHVQWQDNLAMFGGQGLRPFPLDFFQPSEMDRAKEWLSG